MSNGRQIAEHNVAVFNAWIASKTESDFRNMIYRGSLSRSLIAQECGFAKSALAQNPRIKLLLCELEIDLQAAGILPPLQNPKEPADPSPHTNNDLGQHPSPDIPQSSPGSSNLEATLQRLQTENALQRAEIEELRRQLKQYTSIHEALSSTGRMPR